MPDEPPQADPVVTVLSKVLAEVISAEEQHAPISSLHEGYAVILEELEEFWDEVKKKRSERDYLATRYGLIQTAAMCVRTIVNVLDKETS